MSFKLLCLGLILALASSEGIFTLYPLANDYFDLIYEIKHIKDSTTLQTDSDSSFFLRVYCKEHNVVSVSLTPSLQFTEEPRFPIYSRQTKNIPKFQQEIYTFLSSCNVEVKAHPRANSIVEIIRRDNKQPIFQLSDVVLSNGHNKFTVIDKSTKWGIGERFQNKFKVTDGLWTVWNRDKPWEIDQGAQGRSSSTYGHQPLYLAREKVDGYTHLTYFKNTHGMLIEATSQADNLTYNSIGGNIHFLIFVGDKNPEKTIQKYHDFIGGIHIPPFWALGWHQCRWGYKNIEMFSQVIENYEKNDLPLDTMWNDLDYMNQKAIFTIDEKTYPSNKLKNLLSSKNLHWIPLIDVGVSLLDKQSITEGKRLDVFLRDVHNPKEYYVGEVWPGKVHFVDYLHPNASDFWKKQLSRLYEKVPFSGVWLDMNEPSNFRGNEPVIEHYRIQQSESVNQMTIDVNLKHYSTDRNYSLTHWEVHSYYGHTSTVPTFDFLRQYARPFIISRSNSVGTGKYAGHWTGDNSATWAFLRLSISGNFLYQIFGMQMVGADICGFNSDTTESLCSRWTQLGSLYPFARNHNQDIAKNQEPYALGDKVLKTAQISIKQRYSLLKQLYSILVDLNGKGSFFRPCYFQFYEDEQTLKDNIIQTQFMLGSSLLSAPIVEEGKNNRQVYFPGKDIWHSLEYDMQTPGLYLKKNVINSINQNAQTFYQGGKNSQITNQIMTSPPLFLRSGHMIFSNKPQQRSRFLTKQFYVTAALNSQGSAVNRFLTIEDYQNQTVLGRCIEKKECLTKFEIKKSAAAEPEFKLNWTFEGKAEFFGGIQFLSITVWEADKEWTSKGGIVKIDKPTGNLVIAFEAIEHQ